MVVRNGIVHVGVLGPGRGQASRRDQTQSYFRSASRMIQKEDLAGARRCQEEPGGARRARGSQEDPEGARRGQGNLIT